jgi:chromatin remodeling complex protein RSC6
MRSLSGHLTKIGEENNVAVGVPVPVKKAKKVPVPVAVEVPVPVKKAKKVPVPVAVAVAVEVPVPVKKAKKVPVPVPVAVVAPPTVVIPDEAVEGKTLTLSPALSELLNVKALSRGQALKGLWAFIK